MNPRCLFLLLLAGLFSAPSLSAAELQHYWDFEGDDWWLDRVGDADGLVTETTTLETAEGAGGFGASLAIGASVGGDDDHLTVDATELYDPGTEGFGVVYWIRMPDDLSTSPRGIFDFSGNGFDGVQSLYIGTTRELAFRIDVIGGNSLAKAPIPLEDGEWHSVVATYDPAVGIELHIDGFGVDASAAPVSGSIVMAADAYLGSFNFAGAQSDKGLAGDLDDFAIYSGVLTEEEIIAASTRQEPGLKPIESITYESGIVTLTWPAPEGAILSVWGSSDLKSWAEIEDTVVAGVDGGRLAFALEDPQPSRMYFQVRRPE